MTSRLVERFSDVLDAVGSCLAAVFVVEVCAAAAGKLNTDQKHATMKEHEARKL